MSVNVRHWVSQRSMPWAICFTVAGTVLGLTLLKMYWSSASQTVRRPQVVEMIKQPDLPGEVLADNQPIQVGDAVTIGQQLTTQAGAKVALQEDTAGVRLGNRSSVTLEKGCLQLGDGNAVISGLSGCLGAIIVNGTKGIYTLERVNYSAEIKVLAGQVEVSVPRNPAARSITLQDNQKIIIGLTGDEVGPVRLMLPSEVQRIVHGNLFQGFQIPLPKQSEITELRTSPIVPAPAPSTTIKPAPTAPSPTPPTDTKPTAIVPAPIHPSTPPSPSPNAPSPPKAAEPAPQPAPYLRPKHALGCS